MHYLSKTFGLLTILGGAASFAVPRQPRSAEVQTRYAPAAGNFWYHNVKIGCDDEIPPWGPDDDPAPWEGERYEDPAPEKPAPGEPTPEEPAPEEPAPEEPAPPEDDELPIDTDEPAPPDNELPIDPDDELPIDPDEPAPPDNELPIDLD
ncbi:uncharacterized protein DNG_09634 [Cephalotrichum gorgonifer]|uniref:Uncharacterized protein n=1 Tax=Cephalotrichum gorgonifer TaxID=2041049 RepID=A0AAE8N8M8_9PEZI|nr:uncharacterized protein DNG_09634 [Cephalotrichum gorgonifer]